MKTVSNLFHKAAAAFSQSKPRAPQPPGAGLQPGTPDRKSLPTDAAGPDKPPITKRQASTPPAAGQAAAGDAKSSSSQAVSQPGPLGTQEIREMGWAFRKECLACGALVTLHPETDTAGKAVDTDLAYIGQVVALVRDKPQATQPEVAARLIFTSRERMNILTMYAYPAFAQRVDTLKLDRLYTVNNLGATLVGLCGACLEPEGLKAGLAFLQKTLDATKTDPLLDHEKAAFVRCLATTMRQSLTGEPLARSLKFLQEATLGPAGGSGGPLLLARWDDRRERDAALRAVGLD